MARIRNLSPRPCWANWRERRHGRARSEHKLRSAAQAKSLPKNRIDAPSWASVISRRAFDKFMAGTPLPDDHGRYRHEHDRVRCALRQSAGAPALSGVSVLGLVARKENQARRRDKGKSKSEKGALEGRLQPHRAKYWKKRRGVGRQDRASQARLPD